MRLYKIPGFLRTIDLDDIKTMRWVYPKYSYGPFKFQSITTFFWANLWRRFTRQPLLKPKRNKRVPVQKGTLVIDFHHADTAYLNYDFPFTIRDMRGDIIEIMDKAGIEVTEEDRVKYTK